jgi:hypothetical protein
MKANLTQIDKEDWRFILYETVNGRWIGDFVYSPQSFVDLSMLIELTDSEKALAQENRQYLIELSEIIRNNYNDYLKRALNRDNYLFNDCRKIMEKESKPVENSQPNSDSVLDEFTKQMSDSAQSCIEHFENKYGNRLDFSVKSLELIDNILDEASDFYEEMKEAQKKWLISSVGSYIFEVARRNYGGRYYWYDQGNQPIFVTGQPRFEISIIVFDKVRGRLENGIEDNIPFFFKGYSERVENAKNGDSATIV